MPIFQYSHFTSSQLASGIVNYRHNGGDNFHDSMIIEITLEDQDLPIINPKIEFKVKITPINDNPPFLSSPKTVKILQGSLSSLSSFLNITDKDGQSAEDITIRISKPPTNGQIIVSSDVFTYQDVLANEIQFQASTDIKTSSFMKILISDGVYTVSETITIDIQEIEFTAKKPELTILLDQNTMNSGGFITRELKLQDLNLQSNGLLESSQCFVDETPAGVILLNDKEQVSPFTFPLSTFDSGFKYRAPSPQKSTQPYSDEFNLICKLLDKSFALKIKFIADSNIAFTEDLFVPLNGDKFRLKSSHFINASFGYSFRIIQPSEINFFKLVSQDSHKVIESILPANWHSNHISWKKIKTLKYSQLDNGDYFIAKSKTKNFKNGEILTFQIQVDVQAKHSSIWTADLTANQTLPLRSKDIKKLEQVLSQTARQRKIEVTTIATEFRDSYGNKVDIHEKKESKLVLKIVLVILILTALFLLYKCIHLENKPEFSEEEKARLQQQADEELYREDSNLTKIIPINSMNLADNGTQVKIAPALKSPHSKYNSIPHTVITQSIKLPHDDIETDTRSKYSDPHSEFQERKLLTESYATPEIQRWDGVRQSGIFQTENISEDAESSLSKSKEYWF